MRQAGGDAWRWPFSCSDCGKAYESEAFPFCCPACGGLFELHLPLVVEIQESLSPRRGLSHHRSMLPLPPEVPLVSLGEGGTPLLAHHLDDREIYIKCEHLNPTGSFKDRGTAVIVSALAAEGISEAVEDSSGNAGASFAAYCSRAGIRACIYIPEYAAGPKRSQIERMGAEVYTVPGPRSAASIAAHRRAEAGAAYASHAHLPHVHAGMATMAVELVEQLGRAPGAIVTPVGQGTLLLGIYYGFHALIAAGRIDTLPQMVGVQARACAPIWAAHASGSQTAASLAEGETLAKGIRIAEPLRKEAVLAAVHQTGGRMLAVEEAQILAGRNALAAVGFYVEPTSAVVWPALLQVLPELPDPVVVVLTGSGFKDKRIN
ncbi:MAG TPA: pyridoxal-phosphate dependent enzyme [Anaerolineae bacterium]|nr:pyridoxal-phosphate dependent enzyme [Anaerolineae bacterium]